MLTQLAAATAAKGTQRLTRGGALCCGKGTTGVIQAPCKMGVEGLKKRNHISLLPHIDTHLGTQTPSKARKDQRGDGPYVFPTHDLVGLWSYPAHLDWGNA